MPNEVEDAIFNRLSNFAGLSSLVVSRIYPDILPQNPVFPAVTFFRVSGPRVETLSGPSGLAHPRFQVSIWAQTASSKRAVAKQVRLALDGYKGTLDTVAIGGIILAGDTDLYEDDTKLFQKALDFEVWHQEAIS